MKKLIKAPVILFSIGLILRMIFWNQFPPGFTADEATMGYDAYSLLKTGKDQFGNPWPFSFRSFGDYRPPLYVWSVIPFVSLLGLNPLAVRLPSMIAGALEVLMIYFLGKELISKKAGIAAGILLALSPWSLMQTRFAQEANLSTLCIFAGVLWLISWFKKKKNIYLLLSSIVFSLSFYAYHNARLTTPLIVLGGIIVLYRSRKLGKKEIRPIIIAVIVGILFLFPLLDYLRKFPEAIFRRASGQSVFSDPGIKGALWKDIVSMPPGYPVLLSRLQHNKPLYYGRVILRGYFSHFDPQFLFFSGDPHERFRTPYSGLLNWTLLFFIPVGFFRFLKGDQRHRLILWWLLASPIIASLSMIIPNSQHVQDMMIPLHLIAGAGAATVLNIRKIWRLVILGIFFISFGRFLYGYTQIIPHDTRYLQAWHYYGSLFEKLRPFYGQKIIFLGGQYYINLAFYLKYDPQKFQKEVIVSQPENLFEFDHVNSFGNFFFTKTRDIPIRLQSNYLYVRLNEENESLPEDVEVVKRELWPDEKREYIVFQTPVLK